MQEFTTVGNLKACEAKFATYMTQKHNISLDSSATRKLLFTAMKDVQNAYKSHHASHIPPLRTLNNTMLNIANDAVILSLRARLDTPKKGEEGADADAYIVNNNDTDNDRSISRIVRDKEVYGERQLVINELKPNVTTRRPTAEEASRTHKLAMDSRIQGVVVDPPLPIVVEKVQPMVPTEFESRLASLSLSRFPSEAVADPTMPPPKAFACAEHQYENRFQAADLLLPVPKSTELVTVTKYITIDGSDRDYLSEPMRYKFTARTGGIQNTSSLIRGYHNISWIEATRIVIPMEVVAATGSVIMPKGFYNLEYSFAFPYLVLLVDDFDGLMDGTNELLRRAFCVFVFDREYKAPNGRGYVHLKPAQQERKSFSPPLGTLRDLSLSLVRPNGVLFNNSRDNLKCTHIVYEPQNKLFVKLVLDSYFDRNDIWPGDTARIVGFSITVLASSSSGDNGYASILAGASEMTEFMNRSEGHQVVQLGMTNSQGFVNSFYILAPGDLDIHSGSVNIHTDVIFAINSLGVGSGDPTSRCTISSPGRIMNMSLQAVITLRVGAMEHAIHAMPIP